jgi:hypothetical protein
VFDEVFNCTFQLIPNAVEPTNASTREFARIITIAASMMNATS